MAPTRPEPRRIPLLHCPRCGEVVEDVTANSGWIAHDGLGTRVGTYPNMPPAGRIEPCPDFDRYVIDPCGDTLYPNEIEPLIRALRP